MRVGVFTMTHVGVLLLTSGAAPLRAQTADALRTPTAVTIDGRLDEPAYETATPMMFSDPGGISDNAITALLLWDDTHLIIAYRVTDAVIEVGASEIWLDDGFELYIDTRHDHDAPDRTDDYHIIVNVAGTQRLRRGDDLDLAGMLGVDFALVEGGDGYVFEAAIAWADMGVVPAVGAEYGALLVANDYDPPTSRQFAFNALRPFDRPAEWGEIVLRAAAAPPSDGGIADAGSMDAGMTIDRDAGGVTDAGARSDAGTSFDAGETEETTGLQAHGSGLLCGASPHHHGSAPSGFAVLTALIAFACRRSRR